ncbi:MAG: TonB-dependent receptor [Burkholderiales bacterium]|nr:TonB-dependent receptor [Burkholderiales bacterium]
MQRAPALPFKFYIFASLLLAGCSALAEASRDESLFLDEIPVVLSASRLSQPQNEAPVAVTVIDRQIIRESGAWDLSELFRLVPGMFVAYHADRFYATDSTVAYHGLVTNTKSDRMQVLVDGRSVYSSLYGGVIWSDIPLLLDDIERIEVIRGPASASYGANSFAGVINIITSHPAELQGKFASFSAGNGRKESVLRYGGQAGALSYRLSLGWREDSGEDVQIRNATSQRDIWMVNKFDDKEIQQLNWRADYQFSPVDSLEFQLGYNGGPRQMGELNDLHTDDKRARNHFEMLHWRRALNGGAELSLQMFNAVESSRATFIDEDGSHIGDVRTHRRELEIQHTFAPSAQTRLVWGGSIRKDTAFAPYILGVETEYLFETRPYDLQRLFGSLEWRVRPDLVVNAGAMLEHNSYTGSDLTPRLAANWHVTPGHTLRAGFSQATRSPSTYEKVVEEYWRAPDNRPEIPPLRTERVNSAELGYMGKLGALDLDLRLFNDEFCQLIDVTRPSARYGNLNAGQARIRGAEAQVRWQLSPQTRLIYNIAYGKVKSDNINRVIYSDSMPDTSQSLMLSHHFNTNWNASLLGYRVTQTHFNDTDSNPTQNRAYFIPGNQRWDARLAYRFRIGLSHGEVALVSQNIADARYFEYRHDNEVPGRRTRLNLRLDF